VLNNPREAPEYYRAAAAAGGRDDAVARAFAQAYPAGAENSAPAADAFLQLRTRAGLAIRPRRPIRIG